MALASCPPRGRRYRTSRLVERVSADGDPFSFPRREDARCAALLLWYCMCFSVVRICPVLALRGMLTNVWDRGVGSGGDGRAAGEAGAKIDGP